MMIIEGEVDDFKSNRGQMKIHKNKIPLRDKIQSPHK